MDKVLVYLSIIHGGDWNKIYKDISDKVPVDKDEMEKVIASNKFNYITILDPKYPIQLKHIFKPPFVLFYRGNIDCLTNNESKKIAVIGSRVYTEYGKEVTKKICEDIVYNSSCVIVSGLAKGIDAIAHKTCLDCGGKTIAVLGNSLNITYPKENEKLYELIAKEGLLLTEYPAGVSPSKSTFPTRNRIISGISDAVIVTEAKVKSGTMNTVCHALEDGKPIYCVPDKINSDSGCNKLIKEGATLIENGFDVLEELS